MAKDSGCGYGKGTRWGIGVFTGIFVAAVIVAATALGAIIDNVEARANQNTKQIYVNREALARIEERLKSIVDSTRRIESTLGSQQRPPQK